MTPLLEPDLVLPDLAHIYYTRAPKSDSYPAQQSRNLYRTHTSTYIPHNTTRTMAPEATQPRGNISELPVEIEIRVLCNLSAKQIQQMRQVSKHFCEVIDDEKNKNQIIKALRALHISGLEEQIKKCLAVREKDFAESLFEFLEYRGLSFPDGQLDENHNDSSAFVHFWLSSRYAPTIRNSFNAKHFLEQVAEALIEEYVTKNFPECRLEEPLLQHVRRQFDGFQAPMWISLNAELQRYGVTRPQMDNWLAKIRDERYLLPKSAMAFESRRLDSVHDETNGETIQSCPIRIFSEIVRFGDFKTNVFRLRRTVLPAFVVPGMRLGIDDAYGFKQLSPSLNKLYGVPEFDECTSVPYGVASQWARDQVMEQLISDTPEVDAMKELAILEELFIDPRTAAHRRAPFAKAVPVMSLNTRRAWLRQGSCLRETDIKESVKAWPASCRRA